MAASIVDPAITTSDFAKMDRQILHHYFFQAILGYQSQHQGKLPTHNDATAVKSVVDHILKLRPSDAGECPAKELKALENLARASSGNLNPICAFIGGFASHEVLKASSGKFSPLQQFMYFDAEETLPDDYEKLPAEEFQLSGTRHDGQIGIIFCFSAQYFFQLFLVNLSKSSCLVYKSFWLVLELLVVNTLKT